MNRKLKAAYYRIAGPFMTLNGHAYRMLRAPRQGLVKVQLGPGQNNYLPGWINVDANMFTGKCDVWADLRNPLPFVDESVDCFYSHHVVEHLPNLRIHFSQVLRCLKPGGVYRIGGPHGDNAIRKFTANEFAWFGDFPDRRESIGGRLENFLMCRGEHLTILTTSYLEEVLRGIGFGSVHVCLPARETNFREWFEPCLQLETESDFEVPHTLIVEAVKAS
jgi:predicted SAM-dependent methyltransferase